MATHVTKAMEEPVGISRFGASVVAIGVVGASVATAAPPNPILEFRFNDAGTTSASTGSDTSSVTFDTGLQGTAAGAAATLGTVTDLHGAPGSGVSGLAGDIAFNNSASPSMGRGGSGTATAGRAVQIADNDNIDGFASYTLQGWYRTGGTEALGNGAQLISANGNGNFLVNSEGSGPRLTTDNVGPVDLGGTNPTQSWKFFAITYDGTLAANNVRYYQGTTTGAVALVTTATLNAGTITDDGVGFAIGNAFNSFQRPFDGFMDNVRVFGSKTDATGVLELADLETIRVADTTNQPIPEPSTLAFVGVTGAGLLIRRRRASTFARA